MYSHDMAEDELRPKVTRLKDGVGCDSCAVDDVASFAEIRIGWQEMVLCRECMEHLGFMVAGFLAS